MASRGRAERVKTHSIPRRAALRLAAATVALVGGGARAGTRRFTDDTGREILVPERPARVFAAGPPASVAVFALAPRMLLGWPRALRGAEAEYLPAFARDLPETGRLTGRGDTTNLETLVALQPDLIVDVGSVTRTTIDLAMRIQERTGIPYVLLGGRFAETPAMLRRLGEILGVPEQGAALAAYAAAIQIPIAARAATTPAAARPRVYYGRGPQGLETGGPGSINLEILEFSGLANVAAGPPSLFNVSPEQLLAWDPDHLILLDPALRRRLAGHPVWEALGAVRGGRIHVPPSLPFGWIDFPPGLNRLAGLLWIEHAIFSRGDAAAFREAVRMFFARVHHVELDAAAIERLLATG
jgi:iron complex transport system substrate-binding protein